MIVERIKEYIDYKGISIAAFERSIGMSNASFSKSLRNNGAIGTDKLENILRIYEDISVEWLLSGKGKMIKSQDVDERPIAIHTTKIGEGIPLIPIDAMAGAFQGESSINLETCERYVVPMFRNADYLIHVRGDSMQPRYYSGDLVACRNIPPTDLFFQWGKVYIIDTDQGALIKKVEKGSSDETILLVSENEKYKPFEVKRKCIYHIALVLGLIRAE